MLYKLAKTPSGSSKWLKPSSWLIDRGAKMSISVLMQVIYTDAKQMCINLQWWNGLTWPAWLVCIFPFICIAQSVWFINYPLTSPFVYLSPSRDIKLLLQSYNFLILPRWCLATTVGIPSHFLTFFVCVCSRYHSCQSSSQSFAITFSFWATQFGNLSFLLNSRPQNNSS